jgi:hypothetical protein
MVDRRDLGGVVMTTIVLKRLRSRLPDLTIAMSIDREGQLVRLSMLEFDSELLAGFILDMPRAFGVAVVEDERDVAEVRGQPPYRLVVEVAGREHPARVVCLRDGAVTIALGEPNPAHWRRQMPASRHRLTDPRTMREAEAALAERADMVTLGEAAKLSGVSSARLRRWAVGRYPKVIAIHHRNGLRLPRWQFDGALWPVVQRLTRILDAGGPAALGWLETPLGAFEGRTPREALEQGERADRVLALAAAEGFE